MHSRPDHPAQRPPPRPPPARPISTEQGRPGRTLLARSPPLLVYHFDVAILHQQVVGLIAVPSLKARWDLLDFIPPSKILHRQQEESRAKPRGLSGDLLALSHGRLRSRALSRGNRAKWGCIIPSQLGKLVFQMRRSEWVCGYWLYATFYSSRALYLAMSSEFSSVKTCVKFQPL